MMGRTTRGMAPIRATRNERDDSEPATSDLLDRARAGDADALEQLFARHLPGLKRWASGRLPRWARDIADTTDMVQDTLVDTLKRLDRFEYRGDGALHAYLRQAVMNRIRNEFRRLARRGVAGTLDSALEDQGTSPLEAAIGQQTLERYEAGLQRLKPEDREAVVSRVEFGMSYDELAEVLGKPTANAARMAVVRALIRLAEEMKRPV
jgi:RNA polymerase sigma-70 factor (ECF subfamily)